MREPQFVLGILILFCSAAALARSLGTRAVATTTTKPGSLSITAVVHFLVRYGYLEDRLPQGDNNNNNTTTSNSSLFLRPTGPPVVTSPENTPSLYSDREIYRALLDYQNYMSLPATGKLDDATVKAMLSPRCGVKDKTPHAPWMPERLKRRRRYVIEGSKWSKLQLTYKITQPSLKLSYYLVNQTIWEAFRRWAEVCPLTFRWTDNTQRADIIIRFATGKHGDREAFDGPGKVLAHAFYPSHGGQIHFDDDEDWLAGGTALIANLGTKKSLLLVAIHEIGHSLGLNHSPINGAIMNAMYKDDQATKNELSADDVAGIQSIYGLCETSFDSVFSWMGNGRTYFYKDNKYWKYYDWGNEAYRGYPKEINSEWKGVPDNMDEAFLWGHNWKSYFFKGDSYYKYNDALDRVDDGYPKPISFGWPGIPNNIDAAFTWSNDVSYFFKGSLCYKFDNSNDRVATGYPKNISVEWPGIPNDIDTVFRFYWDGKTYFFKDTYYWRWDDTTNRAIGPLRIRNGWKNLCFV